VYEAACVHSAVAGSRALKMLLHGQWCHQTSGQHQHVHAQAPSTDLRCGVCVGQVLMCDQQQWQCGLRLPISYRPECWGHHCIKVVCIGCLSASKVAADDCRAPVCFHI
jgi:hypothetical protein